jgi:hypothetical protein
MTDVEHLFRVVAKGWIGILWGLTPWGASDRYETCPPVLTRRALDLERDLG